MSVYYVSGGGILNPEKGCGKKNSEEKYKIDRGIYHIHGRVND